MFSLFLKPIFLLCCDFFFFLFPGFVAHLFNPAPAQRLQCSSFHNASQNTDQEGSNKHKQTLFDLDLYLTPVQATALFERLSSLLSRHSLDAELEAAFYDIIGPAVSVETQVWNLFIS